MLKRSVIVAGVLAIGFVLSVGTLAFTQEKKPTATRAGLHLIHAAAKSLEDAEKHAAFERREMFAGEVTDEIGGREDGRAVDELHRSVHDGRVP